MKKKEKKIELEGMTKVLEEYYANKLNEWLFSESLFLGGKKLKPLSRWERWKYKVKSFVRDTRLRLGEFIAGERFYGDY